MLSKEDIMKLPQEKLPEIGSDKIYNDVAKIEEDWDNDEITEPLIDLLNTNPSHETNEHWRSFDEINRENKIDRLNVINDIEEKFK